MTRTAIGTFDVTLVPQPPDAGMTDPLLGRMTIEKRFHGDLDATSRGVMVSARTSVQGSAGYVAIEKVEGTLAGRAGTFVLQHTGVMTRGEPSLTVTVVPDSGTGDLQGLSGSMRIIVSGSAHSYEFDYSLPVS